ncbi:MAG TPA: ABC transporter ATP-binding protein [Xanthobacteraceae bacterium]|jgi:branched-chain amino acid transport system ATP-binding protein
MPPLLRVDGVSRSFGALKAVDGLSFEVGEGEALGILGPNGAGKSTLFNLISGDIRPTAGVIALRGHDITRLPSYERCRLGIGRSYQIPQPFGRMTVFENVLAAASFSSGRSESACYDLCIDLLDRTELLEKSNVAAHALTLLERKRLELARALATKPTLLLLDEIAGGLTDGECQELLKAIRAVKHGGVSIIWIEHVVHLLIAFVDRLLVINFGKHLAEGEPRGVMASTAVQEVYMGIEAE